MPWAYQLYLSGHKPRFVVTSACRGEAGKHCGLATGTRWHNIENIEHKVEEIMVRVRVVDV